MKNTFDSNIQDWSVVSFVDLDYYYGSYNFNVMGTYAVDYNSSGGNSGGYISLADPDAGYFTFSAPAAFLGNQSTLYNGTLSYDLFHVGTIDVHPSELMLVGGGIRLFWQSSPTLIPTSAWSTVDVLLAPDAQWKVGTPKGGLATATDFQTVLGDLTGVYILGEYTNGAVETTGLDNIAIVAVPKVNVTAGINPTEGGTVGTFNITLDRALTTNLTVNYTLAGNATLTTDYTVTAGTGITAVTAGSFTILAGQTTASLRVTAASDAMSDLNETVILKLATGSDYQTAAASVSSFTPKVDYGVGLSPFSVSVGDFNGDGKLDLATANFYSNSVSVLLRNADNTGFDANVEYAAGSQPISVSAGDFNGDGKLDLVAANEGGDTVSVLLRNAANTGYDAAVNLTTGATPFAVNVGDFNGDGKTDLVVATNSSSTVSVLLRNATNTGFDAKVDIATGVSPRALGVGDFNSDGKLDLAVANYSYGNVSVLLRNAANTGFDPKIDIATGVQPNSISVADFNGDGKLDLAVANTGSNTVSVLLRNTGNTDFDAKLDLATGLAPTSVSAADFNNDGKTDLVVANNGSNTVSVLLRNAANTGFDARADYASDVSNYSVNTGDFNNDGKTDLAITGRYASVLLNTSSPSATLTIANNTAPSLGGKFTTAGTVNDNATTTPFSGVTVADVDSPNVSIHITYTATNGSLTGTGLTGGSEGNYTLTSASLATVQSELHALVFTPTAGQVATGSTVATTFTLTANDGLVDSTANATTVVTATSKSATIYNDVLNGTAGDDTINGLAGADTMTGGLGNDTYYVDNTGDVVTETSTLATEIDTVNSSITYTLKANVEKLILTGSAVINGTGNGLANTLTGNAAANTLNGSAGADSMTGGLGNDIYTVDNSGDRVIETSTLATQIDTVNSSITHTLSANVEKLTLTGTAAINGTGNGLTNTLTGNTAINFLNGGAGADAMTGGLGNDTYTVDNAGDTVSETSTLATEIDSVNSSVTFALAANIEKLTLTDTTAINGTGNGLANTLTGNAAINFLDGGAGADTMTGGLGNDTYTVDNAGDTVNETSTLATEIDSVYSAVTHILGANVEKLTLTGTAAINGTGNTLSNILTGNDAYNSLTGGNGADTLIGGLGKDSMNLAETVATTDTVRLSAGDSLVSAYDLVNGFKLGTGVISTAGVDKLDLASTTLATNAAGVNGVDAGTIYSHHISNGLISFDDVNTYVAPVAITAANLPDLFSYLQTNIAGGNTVAFGAGADTYVFQDGGVSDTLVELVGVTASSMNTTGLATGSVWLA